MALNPNIPQGSLNKLFSALSVVNRPGLNITAPYLGREMIRIVPEGAATTRIPTATGLVTSPEPYQIVTVTVHLLKPQPLAARWQAVHLTNTLVGPYTVYPDVDPSQGGISPYPIANGMFMGLRELSFNGEDAGWIMTLSGYYQINQALWQAV